MAQTVSVIIGPEDRARLAAILGDRNRPLKHVQRVNIIVLSAERLPVLKVARRAGVSRSAVWRWQVRYASRAPTGCCATRRAPMPTFLTTAATPGTSWQTSPGQSCPSG